MDIHGEGVTPHWFNAGPQAAYWVVPGSTAIKFKWTHEWEVRNGPKGESFWIQGVIPP